MTDWLAGIEVMLQVSLVVSIRKMIRTQAEGSEVFGKGFNTLDNLPPFPGKSALMEIWRILLQHSDYLFQFHFGTMVLHNEAFYISQTKANCTNTATLISNAISLRIVNSWNELSDWFNAILISQTLPAFQIKVHNTHPAFQIKVSKTQRTWTPNIYSFR